MIRESSFISFITAKINMVSFGKSIRIYLKDGTVTGIKFGEIVNQTIQSM